ncbi:MAG: PIG-L family deacetylase [Bryobacteraceae bacterium]|nr:PIG-L family deacetylase [Bryobacteraceae bacterium]
MNRNSIVTNVAAHAAAAQLAASEIVVERPQSGRPHTGKVFVAVHAHSYEVPYYAAGLCAKLIDEGYAGYVVRTSNDQMGGDRTLGENVLNTEQEHLKMASGLGFKDVFDLSYRHLRMNGISSTDIRGRLILIFRALKADTVIAFNPWAPGEDDPDRRVTARAAEEAVSMSGIADEYPEYLEAGVLPHRVSQTYYFHARPGQPFNRVVDITAQVDKKIDAIVECKTQGRGNAGSLLRARLAKQGRRLPLLGADDRTADREYVRQFLLEESRQYGAANNLSYAERFYYIDRREQASSNVEAYIEKNSVAI